MENIKFDTTIKLRSCRVVLNRDILLSTAECRVILDIEPKKQNFQKIDGITINSNLQCIV